MHSQHLTHLKHKVHIELTAAPIGRAIEEEPVRNIRSIRKQASTGPTLGDMAAIEAEMPLIEAELDVLAAEIANIYAADHGGPSPLDWRRLRRAEARVTRVAAELAARPAVRRAA